MFFYIKAKEMLVMSKVAHIKNVHLKSVVRHLKSNTEQFSKRLGLLNLKIPNSTWISTSIRISNSTPISNSTLVEYLPQM